MDLSEVNKIQTLGKVATSVTESVMGVSFIEKLVLSNSSNILWSFLSEL